jgi:uncharacterized SAM-binding protein YcdF (DUF218 family)
VIFRVFWLTAIGSFLVYQDPIAPADAILVLGGGKWERVEQGISLYRAKYADTIMFTGMYAGHGWKMPITHWALEAQKMSVENGIPKDNTVTIFGSSSTLNDATLAKAYCLEHKYKSLIVVTEPYHTRRSHYVFDKVFKRSGVRVMIYPDEESWYAKSTWWHTEEGLMETNSEYLKLLYYLAKGYI